MSTHFRVKILKLYRGSPSTKQYSADTQFQNKRLKKHLASLRVPLLSLAATVDITAQKIKFSIKEFFSKCGQIRSFLRISAIGHTLVKVTFKVTKIYRSYIMKMRFKWKLISMSNLIKGLKNFEVSK